MEIYAHKHVFALIRKSERKTFWLNTYSFNLMSFIEILSDTKLTQTGLNRNKYKHIQFILL